MTSLSILALALLGGSARAQEAPTPGKEIDLFAEEEEDATHVKYGESDEERAAELARNGQVLFDEGQYASAILAWEDSYDLSHDPRRLFDIASAYEKMGAWERAIHALTAYREVAPEAEHADLDARLVLLERVLADAPVVAEPVPTGPVVSEEEVAGVAAMDVPDRVFDDVEERKHKVRPLPIALVGAGLVGLGVGAGFGARSDAAHDAALAECVRTGGSLLCAPGADPWLKQEKRAGLAADTSFVGGGLLVAGGAVLALIRPGRVDVAPAVTPEGGVGVTVEVPTP